MSPSHFKLTSNIWLDSRRALWLQDARTLVVSDLHLGYAWAHRHEGQLLPLGPAGETEARLDELCRDYKPAGIVLLGDIVHRSVPVPALRVQLSNLLADLGRHGTVTLVSGNHDRHLELMLALTAERHELRNHVVTQRCLLVHGDGRKKIDAALPDAAAWDRVVIGHEHPAISLGDGVASWVRCPCFLVSAKVIILPAFSAWAAGSVVGEHPFMSVWARDANFTHVIAVAGHRLLPLPLPLKASGKSGTVPIS
jgi:putative SbcD/Mre11-related phosphoesterase